MTKTKHNSQPVSDRQFGLLFAGFVLLALILAGRDITSAHPDPRGQLRTHETAVAPTAIKTRANLAQK